MRRVGVSPVRSAAKHRSKAQPAARRPEAQARDTPKKINLIIYPQHLQTILA
ncbi:MAG: hypothetical protein NZ455_04425 [Bacteroidia bacterium]|nr:hypothetical protein [Bacteroidia bacterium]MDW8347468.1 hypothetical protein [Bacteroidia bacterium]